MIIFISLYSIYYSPFEHFLYNTKIISRHATECGT